MNLRFFKDTLGSCYLLGWIWHLSAEETQRLETLADGVDVGHAHKHHLTVGIVLWKRRTQKTKTGYLFQNAEKLHLWLTERLETFFGGEDLPGHSQPPPLALLATAAA